MVCTTYKVVLQIYVIFKSPSAHTIFLGHSFKILEGALHDQ